jgi:hypothetical protein
MAKQEKQVAAITAMDQDLRSGTPMWCSKRNLLIIHRLKAA